MKDSLARKHYLEIKLRMVLTSLGKPLTKFEALIIFVIRKFLHKERLAENYDIH